MIHRFTIKRTDSDMIYTRQEELMTPDALLELANDLHREEFYSDASWYDHKRRNAHGKPVWDFVSSVQSYSAELPTGRRYGTVDYAALSKGKTCTVYMFRY